MLNIIEYSNNIYGSEDIKEDSYFENKISEAIGRLIKKGNDKFAIYPMGVWGRYVFRYLNDIIGLKNIVLVDDNLSSITDNIISFEEYCNQRNDHHLLLASNKVDIYEIIRGKVFSNLSKWEYTDLFPLKPLFRKDSRIISLELASREIYKYGIQGNVAEVGVYRGYFASYINHFFPDRMLYLFDTFCGFDEKDIKIEKEREFSEFKEHSCFLDTDEMIVYDKMENKDKCIFKKGYFPDTTSDVDINETFCFVHLDTDLYLPTLNGLRFFYSKLVKGGYIFVHDFNGVAQGVRNAVKEFCDENRIGYVCLPDSVIKGSIVITK